jgi:hypothetical protein
MITYISNNCCLSHKYPLASPGPAASSDDHIPEQLLSVTEKVGNGILKSTIF